MVAELCSLKLVGDLPAAWGLGSSMLLWVACATKVSSTVVVFTSWKKIYKKIFLIKMFLENPSCVQQVEMYSSRKCILPLEDSTCQQWWTRGHCKWNM